MSYIRFVRSSLNPSTSDPQTLGDDHVEQRRRHRALPRGLVARSGKALPRQKKTSSVPRMRYEPRLANVHDFGDGRTAIEFDGPSIDLMLYHDRGVTIAEWVTVEGELLRLIVVGDC